MEENRINFNYQRNNSLYVDVRKATNGYVATISSSANGSSTIVGLVKADFIEDVETEVDAIVAKLDSTTELTTQVAEFKTALAAID